MTQNDPSMDLPWERPGLEPEQNPMDLTMPVGTTPMDGPTKGPLSSLNPEQRARVAAACLMGPLLTSTGFASKSAPDVGDLITISEWVVKGENDLYPYAEDNGNVTLGPDVVLRPDGYAEIRGNLYVPAETEAEE